MPWPPWHVTKVESYARDLLLVFIGFASDILRWYNYTHTHTHTYIYIRYIVMFLYLDFAVPVPDIVEIMVSVGQIWSRVY